MMQTSLNFTGAELSKAGQALALESANTQSEGWGERCYTLFKEYLKTVNKPFLCEDFRTWVAGKIEEPPSNRAYSSVITKGNKEGLIRFHQLTKVNNPKAHNCYANEWVKN